MKSTLIDTANLTLDNEQTFIHLNSGEKLSGLLDKVEKGVYHAAMNRCKGNQVICAKALGVSRGTLRSKLKKYFGDIYFRHTI